MCPPPSESPRLTLDLQESAMDVCRKAYGRMVAKPRTDLPAPGDPEGAYGSKPLNVSSSSHLLTQPCATVAVSTVALRQRRQGKDDLG